MSKPLKRILKQAVAIIHELQCEPSSEEFSKAIDTISDAVIREYGLMKAISESQLKLHIRKLAIDAFCKRNDGDALAERIDR